MFREAAGPAVIALLGRHAGLGGLDVAEADDDAVLRADDAGLGVHVVQPAAVEEARDFRHDGEGRHLRDQAAGAVPQEQLDWTAGLPHRGADRSEEHTSELQSLMRLSY